MAKSAHNILLLLIPEKNSSMEVMRRVFIAFESGAASLMCGCVYWCPLTPLNGGADARVLLSIVDLYLKMKVASMLELLSFVFAFRTEKYLLESTVFPLNLIERCILLLAFTVLQMGVVLFGNVYLLTFPSSYF